MKGHAIVYSAAELTWLEARKTWPIGDYADGFATAFGRVDVTPGHLHALRKRRGWKTGRSGRFEPGAVSHNKGKRCPEGTGGRHPNAVATQFKHGERRGVAVALHKPVGTERVSKDGYRERKIHDGLPLQSRWRAIHLIAWEAVHGPVPPGHCLKCLDGDRSNVDAANWVAIPRALLPRLNGGKATTTIAYDSAAPEVKAAVLTAARVAQAMAEVRQAKGLTA